MNRFRLPAAALAAALLLAGCATPPVRAPVQVDPMVAGRADAERASLQSWRLAGRVAISGGRQGGSGRLDWAQAGGRYDVTLSAPVTRQGWRLSGDARHARLEGVEGGPREGADVEALLFEATGWDIPVRALVAWVRGVAAPEAMHGPARVDYGADALPVRLEQAGWTIGYGEWFAAGIGQPPLPRRIEATRGDARVRLVVDGWTVLPGGPSGDPPGPAGAGDDGG
ncbi:outer membrane lipoprotein LolB [Luteimonas sp. J16]|jgi:outer membrane lipoprotein LolB|uniref:lipoprotein insertase outer membrane protein LolB n=1 Tax=unclassified Luteimonas TaxID=2629088 RepID=UPI0004AE72AE|nr:MULTISPECIES: lipoprotein insertase outer membrane protein LolB [unclassified Luteimonas]TWG88559.1 outer membrane lipoprotein LolB [Luteimonas sp. J16]